MPVALRRRPSTAPYHHADPALYLVGREFGDLTIVAPVAEGGTASVYLANDGSSGRMVAVKILHPTLARQPDLVARFHAELEIARRVQHPGLLTIHSVTSIAGIPGLVMEVAPGHPLGTLICAGGMRLGDVITIGAHVAAALDALHRAGYAHRDVKPDNVMVARAPGGRLDVLVLDFGIALPIGVRAADSDTVSGTPLYMPPEQWRGATVESRGDVYALGCVLYEALTGVPPFDGPLVQLANAHYFRTPEPILDLRADVPAPLADLVTAMLAKDVVDRPGMVDVTAELYRLAPRAHLAPVSPSYTKS